jgi:hypothetical protein
MALSGSSPCGAGSEDLAFIRGTPSACLAPSFCLAPELGWTSSLLLAGGPSPAHGKMQTDAYGDWSLAVFFSNYECILAQRHWGKHT